MLQNTSDLDQMVGHQEQKHVKATPITAEQYLRDQISRNTTTDTQEDILKIYE